MMTGGGEVERKGEEVKVKSGTFSADETLVYVETAFLRRSCKCRGIQILGQELSSKKGDLSEEFGW
jgi:hypothetical protein